MEANNIIAAPQVADVNELYANWHIANVGNMVQFYKFLTTPGPERDEFINANAVDISFAGSVLMTTVQP